MNARQEKRADIMDVMLNILKISFLILAGLIVVVNILIFIMFRLSSNSQIPKNTTAALAMGQDLLSTEGETVVAVVAHPDDADWYAGGALALLARKNKVIVIVGTSGEKGGRGDGLAAVREKEQQEAAEILGVDNVVFLRYPDRGLADVQDLASDVEVIIKEHDAGIVFSFDTEKEGFIYHHADHRAAGEAALTAGISSGTVKKLILFHSKEPNAIIDISDVADKKAAALSKHVSQQNSRATQWFRYIPILSRPRGTAGSGQNFNDLGIEIGETYRIQEISK